jgi:hypothetical protein
MAMHRVFGYLKSMISGKMLIDAAELSIQSQVQVTIGRQYLIEIYLDAMDYIPRDMPIHKGRAATMTTFVDADHARDKVTYRSVTGVLMLLNNTSIQWVSKRQLTVETSTYGSELIATRIAIDMNK